MARYPVQEEGSEAPLKEDGAPGHQMGDGLPLLLPSVPGKSTAKFPDLLCCHRMPTTERLSHHQGLTGRVFQLRVGSGSGIGKNYRVGSGLGLGSGIGIIY